LKVLLIIHDNYQEDNYFPLGPAYIASYLREKGHEIDIYCMDVFHYTNKDLALYLNEHDIDYIGIGFLAGRYNETVIDLCAIVNQYKKNAKIVLGGQGPSPIPGFMLRNLNADVVIIGEGEETFAEIVDGIPFEQIKGIAYKCNGDIKINPRRKPIRNLDSLPFPAWDLFPMDKYINSVIWPGWEEGDKTFCILTSRGCTNACTFCYRMDKGIRVRSINNIMAEMKLLHERYGINYFLIQDECFIISEKRLETFINGTKNLEFKIKYYCDSRVEFFNERIAKLLKESGCMFTNFGFESNNQVVLNNIKKNTTVEQNIRAAEISKKYKLPMGLNLLWNMPGDTVETLQNNVNFLKKYNTYVQLRTIKPATPYPGCELYYWAILNGRLEGPEDFFAKFKNLDLITVNHTDLDLDTMYKALYNANKALIFDHYAHTSGNIDDAKNIINQFKRLYFEGETMFRGARHYESPSYDLVDT